MSLITCQQAMNALKTLDSDPEAYWILQEFIYQCDDLMKFRLMTIPMLLRPFKSKEE